MKKLFAIMAIGSIVIACNNESKTETTTDTTTVKTVDSLKNEMDNLSDSVNKANEIKKDSAAKADSVAARK